MHLNALCRWNPVSRREGNETFCQCKTIHTKRNYCWHKKVMNCKTMALDKSVAVPKCFLAKYPTSDSNNMYCPRKPGADMRKIVKNQQSPRRRRELNGCGKRNKIHKDHEIGAVKDLFAFTFVRDLLSPSNVPKRCVFKRTCPGTALRVSLLPQCPAATAVVMACHSSFCVGQCKTR